MDIVAVVPSGRTIGVMLRVLTLALATGCLRSPPAPTPHEVRYRVEWERDGVATTSDGGWEVSNDLGYRVHVTRGWVTSYSMELVECPKGAPAASLRTLPAVIWSAVESSAWAGHLAGTPNPAAIKPMQVESMTQVEPHQLGAVTLAPQAYCKLHYLLARAGHDSPGLPSDLDMVDVTLHLDGTFRAPGSSAEMPFTIHTASAYGQLFEQAGNPPAAIHVDTGIEAAQVEVRRHLGRMFDGVDFMRMADRAIALQILKALVDHVDVEIVRLDGKH